MTQVTTIVLWSKDEDFASRWRETLRHFGYRVLVRADEEELSLTLAMYQAGILLCDGQTLAEWQGSVSRHSMAPVADGPSSWQARLLAQRHGMQTLPVCLVLNHGSQLLQTDWLRGADACDVIDAPVTVIEVLARLRAATRLLERRRRAAYVSGVEPRLGLLKYAAWERSLQTLTLATHPTGATPCLWALHWDGAESLKRWWGKAVWQQFIEALYESVRQQLMFDSSLAWCDQRGLRIACYLHNPLAALKAVRRQLTEALEQGGLAPLSAARLVGFSQLILTDVDWQARIVPTLETMWQRVESTHQDRLIAWGTQNAEEAPAAPPEAIDLEVQAKSLFAGVRAWQAMTLFPGEFRVGDSPQLMEGWMEYLGATLAPLVDDQDRLAGVVELVRQHSAAAGINAMQPQPSECSHTKEATSGVQIHALQAGQETKIGARCYIASPNDLVEAMLSTLHEEPGSYFLVVENQRPLGMVSRNTLLSVTLNVPKRMPGHRTGRWEGCVTAEFEQCAQFASIGEALESLPVPECRPLPNVI